jgi:hypothetical protein
MTGVANISDDGKERRRHFEGERRRFESGLVIGDFW